MNPLYVAIDTPDLDRATALAGQLAGRIGGVKLGLEFFAAQGPAGVRAVAELGLPIFLDLKLHDIPNTVAGALQAHAALGPAILNVHATGGRAMMEAARAACPSSVRVIAVTMLTSLDASDLAAIGVNGSADAHVERLARLARESGLDGVVCSAAEAAQVRQAWPDALIVTPGIRPAGARAGDQKRMATPASALAAGADILVIGRPITAAPDPRSAVEAILATLPAGTRRSPGLSPGTP
jgi:orotidine-5'-phosphate decarboxylase